MRHLMLALAVLASGCCTSNGRSPVYVETSLARLELPERPTRVVRLSAGASESAYYALTDDQITQAPSFERARADDEEIETGTCDDESEDGLFGRVDICLAKRLSLGYSRRNDGPPMGHAVLYLAGRERERAQPGDFSMALSFAWGRDDFGEIAQLSNGDRYETRGHRRARDVGLVLGVRTARWAMVYGGPYRLDTELEFRHQRPDAPTQDASGHIRATGGHLGLGLFAGRHSSWLLEYSRARVDTGESQSLGNWSFRYQLEFFGRTPAPKRRKPAPPPGGAS